MNGRVNDDKVLDTMANWLIFDSTALGIHFQANIELVGSHQPYALNSICILQIDLDVSHALFLRILSEIDEPKLIVKV